MRRLIQAGLAACGLAAVVALLCTGSAGAATAAATTSAGSLPVIYNFPLGLSKESATASPPGANVGCTPSAAHPYPVVLVHGTFEDMADNFNALSPLLANNGYCVYAFNYGSYDGSGALGVYGTGDIPTSAQQLSTFVNQVLAATGASKVDIVGHSQGGMMPRYYLKFLGGQSKVEDMIGLAPSNQGTTLDGLATLSTDLGWNGYVADGCPSCEQQEVGSSFITHLNAGGDTVPGVAYTVIETQDDEVVTPYTNAFITGPNVTTDVLQNQCALDHSDHLSITYDHIALADVLTALGTPEHPACAPVLPLVGG